MSDPRDLVAGPSALDLAILRLDRAVVGLEQRMEGLIGRAVAAGNDLFDEDRSQLAAELDGARARERELVAAGRDGRLLGTRVHNVQVMTKHADGHVLTNDEVADFYMRAHDFGMRHGVVPCFEVHVNMWSEHLGRVEQVAAIVKRRGVPFHMTLDHSHVIFKIDNPKEQLVQDMKADVDSGKQIGRAHV